MLGRQYRALWALPIEVPVLDVTREAGGLTPLKLGGQSQSITLRLAAGDGKLYMLRSIDKVAVRSLAPAVQQSFAGLALANSIQFSSNGTFMR
jgi:hypothetical protein